MTADPCSTAVSRSPQETQKLKKKSVNCPLILTLDNPFGIPQTFVFSALLTRVLQPAFENASSSNGHATHGRAPAMGVVLPSSHFPSKTHQVALHSKASMALSQSFLENTVHDFHFRKQPRQTSPLPSADTNRENRNCLNGLAINTNSARL